MHEPDARELQPDTVLQDLFDQGRQVGEAGFHPMMPGGRIQFDISVPILGELARLSPHNYVRGLKGRRDDNG